MKIKLTKWERNTLFDICKTLPGGTLGQIEQDMRIMNKLELSNKDSLNVFWKEIYSEEELRTFNNLLGKVNLNASFLNTNRVLDCNEADMQTELTFEEKDVKRLIQIAQQGSGYPKIHRTLDLKKSIDMLQEKLK